jgi:phosphoribosyl 1,2-cyclic phosphate phosphodiesterase
MVKPFTLTPPQDRVQVFGNRAVLDGIRAGSPKGVANALELNLLRPHEPITTRDGDVIVPLPATHSPNALVLRITRTRESKSIFYGHDSGVFPAETIDALNRAGPLEVAIFDCTNGGEPSRQPGSHMGVAEVVQMVEALRRGGAIVDRTRCVATHFSHTGNLSHEERVRALMPRGIEAAFDGMVVSA